MDAGECNRLGTKSERRKALGLEDAFEFPNECHQRLADYLTGDDGTGDHEKNGLVRELAGIYVDLGHGNFFDESSGLEPDVLEVLCQLRRVGLGLGQDDHAGRRRALRGQRGCGLNTPYDLHVTERAWTTTSKTMLSAAITEYGASDRVFQLFEAGFATPEPVLRVLCGGSERYDRLKEALTMKRRGDPHDIYVLTFNPCARDFVHGVGALPFYQRRAGAIHTPVRRRNGRNAHERGRRGLRDGKQNTR